MGDVLVLESLKHALKNLPLPRAQRLDKRHRIAAQGTHLIARRTYRQSLGDREHQALGCIGFSMKSYAPSFIASTAKATLPWPVMTRTGVASPRSRNSLRTASPSIPGI